MCKATYSYSFPYSYTTYVVLCERTKPVYVYVYVYENVYGNTPLKRRRPRRPVAPRAAEAGW
jgi:hypothetical protein